MKALDCIVPGLRAIASGSSSFDLARQTGEPLTGRKATLYTKSLSNSRTLR